MFSMKLDHAFNVSQQSINILYKSVLNNSIYNLNRVVILIHLTFFPMYNMIKEYLRYTTMIFSKRNKLWIFTRG